MGRMEKGFVELNRFHIGYEPRIVIKRQVLDDFIAEFQDTELQNLPYQLLRVGGKSLLPFHHL